MRQWLRIKWLWLKNEYKHANSHCVRCGRRGASPGSLAQLTKLCDGCYTAVCQQYDTGENNE
jgi:NMD protein affecting ribosome stability and mRNA decay